MPKLSIIIPTFNSAGTLVRCLESIRVQTFKDYEIVIQDGGSSDGTAQVIAEFQQKYPGISLEMKQERDQGPYDAMNKAMQRARGDWFYFLGSDDELYDGDALEKVLSSPAASDGDVLYGNVRVVGSAEWAADGAIYDGAFDLTKILSRNICHQAMFYRASFLSTVGSFNPKYIVCADWDFNMRCWAKGQLKYVDVVVAKFYAGGISSQRKRDLSFEADVTSNVIRYFNLSDKDPLVNSASFCGRNFDEARHAARITPRRVLRALARRLGSAC